jgi:hypothetical protein
VNETRFVKDKTWSNRVHLAAYRDGKPDHFETVYSYSYPSETKEQQPTDHYGFWGPEVETMRTFSDRINPMGFSGNWLIQDDVCYVLDGSNTYLQDDRNGLFVMYETSTRDFLVH